MLWLPRYGRSTTGAAKRCPPRPIESRRRACPVTGNDGVRHDDGHGVDDRNTDAQSGIVHPPLGAGRFHDASARSTIEVRHSASPALRAPGRLACAGPARRHERTALHCRARRPVTPEFLMPFLPAFLRLPNARGGALRG
jgi:hypothetical protein